MLSLLETIAIGSRIGTSSVFRGTSDEAKEIRALRNELRASRGEPPVSDNEVSLYVEPLKPGYRYKTEAEMANEQKANEAAGKVIHFLFVLFMIGFTIYAAIETLSH